MNNREVIMVCISQPDFVSGPYIKDRSVQISELIDQMENESARNSATTFAILNRCYAFTSKNKDSKAVFCDQAAKQLVEKHRNIVINLKDQMDTQKRNRQSPISPIFEGVYNVFKHYFQDVKVAIHLTGTEKRTLGWDITILKTLAYSPFFTAIASATAMVVAAVALPFFINLGLVAAGTTATYLLTCAAVDLTIGCMEKIYFDYMYEDELEDFEAVMYDYRLKVFMEDQIHKGFSQLQGNVSDDSYQKLKIALANL